MDYNIFNHLVNKYSKITIFHHINGDFDCIGSAIGLKSLIQYNFPDKQVEVVGEDFDSIRHFYPREDIDFQFVSDQFITESLAIIVDTANRERIDDQRYILAKEILKIDHHLIVDDYANYQIVDASAAATSEVIYQIIKSNNLHLTAKASYYFYMSLVGDSLSFSTSTTTTKTMEAAYHFSKLIPNISALVLNLRAKSLELFKLENQLRSKIVFQNDLAYIVVERNLYQESYDINTVKSLVNIMANIEGIEKWLIAAEDDNGLYQVSIRSKSYNINQVAILFNGGGHKCASGVKNLTLDDLKLLIIKLEDIDA